MKNIALIGYSLNHGGAEKNMANLSILLQNDFKIHLIIVNDGIAFDFAGKLLNLGLLPNKNLWNRFNKFFTLKKYIKKEKIDIIIDFRSRINKWDEILIANFLYYNCKPIFTIHSYNIEDYLPKNKLLFKLWSFRNPKLIAVSKSINQLIVHEFQYQNCDLIYNAFNIEKIKLQSQDTILEKEQFIVFVGRLSFEKQIPELIISYFNSILPHQNIKLLIIGEGFEKEKIEQKINQFNLNDKVILLGKKQNPFAYMKKAKFLVLCSKFEGFPNVLIESLICETPIVSFDCASGPNEIIMNQINGLLVENQNFNALTQAMNMMIENEKLYLNCKKNTSTNIELYSFDSILKTWLEILKKQV